MWNFLNREKRMVEVVFVLLLISAVFTLISLRGAFGRIETKIDQLIQMQDKK